MRAAARAQEADLEAAAGAQETELRGCSEGTGEGLMSYKLNTVILERSF